MFDTTLKCANIDEHKQLAQQVAYYDGNSAKQRKQRGNIICQ